MIAGLTGFVGHGVAPENKDVDFDVQQVLFKTVHGNIYRALILSKAKMCMCFAWRRGKGQAEVRPGQLGTSAVALHADRPSSREEDQTG